MSAGSNFRAAYDADFEPSTPADTAILDRACALLDQVEGMEAIIADEGYTTMGGNGQKSSHPLLATIRAHSAEISRLVRQLGLESETPTTQRARRAANARWARS